MTLFSCIHQIACFYSAHLYLQFSCHVDDFVRRGVVFVTVGKHQSDVRSKLCSLCILALVHFLLRKGHVNMRC